MNKFKATLLFIAPLLIFFIAISFLVYNQLSEFARNDLYDLLTYRNKLVANYEFSIENETSKQSKDTERLYGERDYVFKIKSENEIKTLADSLKLEASFISNIFRNSSFFYNTDKQYFYGKIYTFNKEKHIVITSATNYFGNHLDYLRRVFYYYLLVYTLVIFIYYHFYVKNIYQPIKQIIEKVKQITTNNLNERLDENHRISELNKLSKTFNNMLMRLETSFETQSNFVSNASHELRTPLTSIIGEADVALSKIRSQESYIESLKIIIEEAEKLENKTKALLFLAQTSYTNNHVQKFDKTRIDQVIMDVKETILSIIPHAKVNIDLTLLPDNPWLIKINGNNQLLHLAFSNLVSNACKYSNNKIVNIALGSSDNKVYIVIKDQGIGIPESEIKHIYEPFFRASNTKKFEGFGIGMPLVNNIIKLHNGQINVHSIENKGTTIEVTFPIYNKPAEL